MYAFATVSAFVLKALESVTGTNSDGTSRKGCMPARGWEGNVGLNDLLRKVFPGIEPKEVTELMQKQGLIVIKPHPKMRHNVLVIHSKYLRPEKKAVGGAKPEALEAFLKGMSGTTVQPAVLTSTPTTIEGIPSTIANTPAQTVEQPPKVYTEQARKALMTQAKRMGLKFVQ